jgi:hypothetical protein
MKILNQNDTNTRGILIEYDAGHIKPSENKSVIREMKEMNKDNFVLYAVLQKYDTPNKNGRIYGERILKRETDNYKTLIEQGRALGELNHPETSLVDLERTSHRITECWWDGKILMGKVELLTSEAFRSTGQITCMGDIAANLLLHGVTLGISSRGVGSLKKSGEYNEVQDDFEMVCFDLVSSPSTPGAYLFQDEGDREKYAESIDKKEPTITDNKTLNLMNKLNSFLGK